MFEEIGNRQRDPLADRAEAKAIADRMVDVALGKNPTGIDATVDMAVKQNSLGPEIIVQAFAELLGDQEPLRRVAAAFFLIRATNCHTYGSEAIGLMTRALSGKDQEQKIAALLLSGQLDQIPRQITSTLRRMLDDDATDLRILAAAALRETPEAVRILRQALRQEREELVLIAGKALIKMGLLEAFAEESLLARLEKMPPALQRDVIASFSRLGMKADRAIPLLIECTSNPRMDPDSRSVAAIALGRIGRETKKSKRIFSEPLAIALKSENWKVACASAIALREMGELVDNAIGRLEEILEDPTPATRAFAADCLGEFGPLAANSISYLYKRFCRETDHSAIACLFKAIQKIGTSHFQDQEQFIDLIFLQLVDSIRGEQDGHLQESRIRAITFLGSPAIPKLIRLAQSDDATSIQIAVKSLIPIGLAYREEVSRSVVGNLIDPDRQMVCCTGLAILVAMEAWDEAVKATIDLLEGAMIDWDWYPDLFAFLRNLGPKAASATTIVIGFLFSPNPYLATLARETLLAIGPAALPGLSAAFAEVDEARRERMVDLIGKLEEQPRQTPHSIERQNEVPLPRSIKFDLAELRIDKNLRTFAEIGLVLREHGELSYQKITEILNSRSGNRSSALMPNTARLRISSLEAKLSEEAGLTKNTSLHLITKNNTRAGGLTAFGREFLVDVLEYLNIIDKSSSLESREN